MATKRNPAAEIVSTHKSLRERKRIWLAVMLAALSFSSDVVGAPSTAASECERIAGSKVNVKNITARVTSMLGRHEYLVDIIRPTTGGLACLVFRERLGGSFRSTGFELEMPGQLGIHVVTLARDYLVVESGTGNGSFLSEIFSTRDGLPIRVRTVFSTTPPNFINRDGSDYVVVNAATPDGPSWIRL